MVDTSLWPVVVGGLLTGLFALGGIGVGLVGASRRDKEQERRDDKKRRAEKFEELVAAVYEFDHWVIAAQDIPRPPSPFAKVQSISSVYFPQFSKLIQELDTFSKLYIDWLQAAAPKTTPTDVSHWFNDVYFHYGAKRDELLGALNEFAHEHFQENPTPSGPGRD